jgi:hypothetical protein
LKQSSTDNRKRGFAGPYGRALSKKAPSSQFFLKLGMNKNNQTWMAGTSPAMAVGVCALHPFVMAGLVLACLGHPRLAALRPSSAAPKKVRPMA